jgi:hypothetical protein
MPTRHNASRKEGFMPKTPHTTIRFSESDKQVIEVLKTIYKIDETSELIRFLLREAYIKATENPKKSRKNT